jgi:hypothetical protein
LDETPTALYRVKEIYPREGVDLGVYRYGDELLCDMSQPTAVILALEPVASGSTPRRPELGAQKDNLTVIPAFQGSQGRQYNVH